MSERTKSGTNAGPNGDTLNWRDTNGVETTDSQADGTDVAENQDGSETSSTAPGASRHSGKQNEDAVEGGSAGDGTAPDQRTPDDAERSDENRGSKTPDTGMMSEG